MTETASGPSTDRHHRSHRLARAFRAILEATARPGALRRPPAFVADPAPLSQAATAVVFALSDQDAPVWLAPRLREDPTLTRRLRFECGAALAESPDQAAFLLGDWEALEAVLPAARRGTPERPDLSATMVVETQGLSDAPAPGHAVGLALAGPGVAPDTAAELWIDGVDMRFTRFLAENRAAFPCGIDVILTANEQLAAAPRSLRARVL